VIRSNNEIMSRPRNIKARTQNSTNINILNNDISPIQHKLHTAVSTQVSTYNMITYLPYIICKTISQFHLSITAVTMMMMKSPRAGSACCKQQISKHAYLQ